MGWSKKNGVWNLHKEPTCLCAFDADPWNYVRNGSGVSRWNDLTGHGYHALQPTALNQPTWIEKDSDFGGHGSLNLNGTSSFMYVPSIAIQTGFTWYSVVKWGTSTKSKTIVDQYATPTMRQALYSDVNGHLSGFAAAGIIAGTADTRNAICVVAFVANGASSRLMHNAVTVATGNAGPSAMADLCIGAYGGSTNYLEGKMAALYGFVGAHSLGFSQQISKHLACKYGVAS